MTATNDTEEYRQKKRFFNNLLTIFGRKPVLEALQEPGCSIHRLHLASSNKSAAILDDIIKLATQKGAEIVYHDRQSLSRISKNSKQDQGIAADLICSGYQDYRHYLDGENQTSGDIIALDRITNPQNLGMIIRSVCAGDIAGLLLPRKGCAKLDALVIKASTGTLFRAPILRCDDLEEALQDFAQKGYRIYGLSSHADLHIGEINDEHASVFVLGNETEGVSTAVQKCCDFQLRIPMNNQVESLNVAVTASLLAFRKVFK